MKIGKEKSSTTTATELLKRKASLAIAERGSIGQELEII